MTEFDKFWEKEGKDSGMSREFAERVWERGQRAIIRTISNPPVIPKVGDAVRLLGLCHSNSLRKIRKVTDVEASHLDVHYVTGMDEEGNTSCGILGEVELVNEN